MVVFMRSEEFGYEEFEAETFWDAADTMRRLRDKAVELNDGIRREIGIVVND